MKFGRIAAMVPVTEVARSLAFYVGVLGMTEVFRNGDPVGFVILERDAAELHLTLDPGHRRGPAACDRSPRWAIVECVMRPSGEE